MKERNYSRRTSGKKDLISFIGSGKENSTSWQRIASYYGFSDRRSVQSLIAEVRTAGAVILPDYKGGYYKPDTHTAEGQEETRVFINRMSSAAKSSFKAVQSARKMLKEAEEEH